MSDDMTDFDPFEDLSDEELDAMLESGELAGGMKPAELCADDDRFRPLRGPLRRGARRHARVR